jgi:hypothetical protein
MLDKANFLPHCSRPSERDWYWDAYNRAQCFFRDELGFGGTVVKVYDIEIEGKDEDKKKHAFYATDNVLKISEIAIRMKDDGPGVLFHEITHDLFHHSRFHNLYWPENELSNEKWGEAFCEAFRYVFENEAPLKSKWVQCFESVHLTGDSDKSRARRILAQADDPTPLGLAKLWSRIHEEFDKTPKFLTARFLWD